MGMKRGSIVTVAVQGDFGKPRPALVIQSDLFAQHPSIAVLLITSTLTEAPLVRIDIAPTHQNGLHQTSQIEVDKIITLKREKIGAVLGELEDDKMLAVNRAMVVFLGLA
jgi:mRNA interferase MazF